ncbi:MAG TPA: sulfatase-like hydrolase/transferase [Caldilineae bacterium]|nr:sulfatase-like hydrolase/transferase [Caldilineae bacterium]
MSRPNILLIHSDQHRYDCLGVTGHPILKTPHLDRLAAEGMIFTHAFCPIPLCIPVRNSLLHGRWATQHLSIANWDTEAPRPPREGLPTFSQALRDAGYFLGYVGKWHVHPEKDARAYGFHEYVPEETYDEWRTAAGYPPRPRTNGWFGEIDPHIPPEASRLAWGADHTIRLLEACAASGAPFFIRWDPSEPHLPNVVPEPYGSMYPPAEIPPWPSFPDPLIGKPYIQAQQRRTWKVDGWTWDDWAPVVSRYLGEITLMDAQIGRVLDALDRLGLAENTLVIYTTDHGDLCGGHGMIDKHFIMYDDVVRVPLIMRWPGHIVPGSRCDAFVAHSIDLATTFCEVARVSVPETFQGLSLLPLMAGEPDNGRQDIFATYHGNQFGLYSQRMVRDRRWKYVWNATAEDELYDLESDPGELHNLAADPAYRDELARLRRRLVAWMEETGDPLLNSWIRVQLLEGLKA